MVYVNNLFEYIRGWDFDITEKTTPSGNLFFWTVFQGSMHLKCQINSILRYENFGVKRIFL